MRKLEGLQPERVLYYFEEISAIPRGSGHTRAISDHLAGFAKEHGLSYTQDEMGNVVIRRPASQGCEKAPVVILQGHMDMVAEKEADCTLDMEKEGLSLVLHKRKDLDWLMKDMTPWQTEEDLILKADGTTLGADDGVAVAYMLAILESDTIKAPALECVFTVDEEIGMLGAVGMDMSGLKGRMLLNIDSEEEGELLTGCAGGCISTITVPVSRETCPKDRIHAVLSVKGLKGGHSGNEIDKDRANADMLLGRLLQGMFREFGEGILLISVNGGTKDNAIPRSSEAEVLIRPELKEAMTAFIREEEENYRKEYGERDPGLVLGLQTEESAGRQKEGGTEEKTQVSSGSAETVTPGNPMDGASASRVVQLLRILPNGIQRMSHFYPGLVQTSLNLGILTTDENEVSASLLVRSNVNSEKLELIGRLQAVADALGGTCRNSGNYPAWEFREQSQLRPVMQECFEKQYGKPMVEEIIHAGVECGLFSDGIPDLDVVSFGPELRDIHTPRETMDLASVERTWRFILSVLEKLSEA